jgi:hypothetical protein
VEDWSLHAPECKALQRVRSSDESEIPTAPGFSPRATPPEWVRALARLVWARNRHKSLSQTELPAVRLRFWLSMSSRTAERGLT